MEGNSRKANPFVSDVTARFERYPPVHTLEDLETPLPLNTNQIINTRQSYPGHSVMNPESTELF